MCFNITFTKLSKETYFDAPLSPSLDPLEGPSRLSCGKLGLEGRSRLLALERVEERARSPGIKLGRRTSYLVSQSCIQNQPRVG
jgi:hypothetical protein